MQTILVALVLAAAVAYLGRRWWAAARLARRPASEPAGCGDGCGCGPAGATRSDTADWSGETPRSLRG